MVSLKNISFVLAWSPDYDPSSVPFIFSRKSTVIIVPDD